MDLQELPEGCIANIISLTSPQDACRLSLLSKIFRSAADSDAVWDKFLPPETQTILSHSGNSELLAAKSRKELYLALCDKPVLVDEGKLSFSLDKWSGKKCYMISARELGIVWGKDRRYWRWASHPESRFGEVAELLFVCWLELHGKLETRLLSPSTLYKAYLVFKFTSGAYGFEHLPAEVSVGLEGGETSKQTVFLHNEREVDDSDYSSEEMDYSSEGTDASSEEMENTELMDYAPGRSEHLEGESTGDVEGEINNSKRLSEDAAGDLKDVEGEINDTGGRDDTEEESNYSDESNYTEAPEVEMNEDRHQRDTPGWLEIEMGEFFCEGGEDEDLIMSCLANGDGHWKRGLIVQGIDIRPKRK
ncbi:putative F-box protein PP2-B12 [Argentina anserina]|uniref:putative F-box protein PP2-B12 n=1 Tax=Argentina anserina TaxID=57926 RepID=UPI0021767F0E|nr:putative F-box protein PP2-B12 [Potentilla anserina]